MKLGTGTLKIASGVGTLAACGLSGVAVAADTKPIAAPLKPPLVQSVVRLDASPGLTIPQTPLCQKRGVSPPPALSPELQSIAGQLKGATKDQRAMLLEPLSPAERQQVNAAANIAAGGGVKGCGTGQGPVPSETEPIAPKVSDAGPNSLTPMTNSYVS